MRGVSYSAFRKWIQRGNKGRPGDELFVALVAELQKKEAEREAAAVKQILVRGEKTRQACAWWLECRPRESLCEGPAGR